MAKHIVIETCDDCHYAKERDWEGCTPGSFCNHPQTRGDGWHRETLVLDSAPPAWCPLEEYNDKG